MNRILIVDDAPANLVAIGAALKDYQRLIATSGEAALQLVENDPLPDLILLDVIMPGMDGYETCKRLKADPRTADIPVIFLTAENDRDHIRHGFDSGGCDYVTKPFDDRELVLRVKNHLDLHIQKQELLSANKRLLSLEQQRDALVHMIAHDMRSPLQVISGNLELLLLDADTLPTQTVEDLHDCADAAKSIEDMINSMLTISRMEAGNFPLNKKDTDVSALVNQSLRRYSAVTEGRVVTNDMPPEPVMAFCDDSVVGRVITNFLDNALKYTPANAPVHITLTTDGENVRFAVKDNGPGIAPEYHAFVFEKFARLNIPSMKGRKSFGIGLAFCRMAIESHGGIIGVESDGVNGSTFWFSIPVHDNTPAEPAGIEEKPAQ